MTDTNLWLHYQAIAFAEFSPEFVKAAMESAAPYAADYGTAFNDFCNSYLSV